MKLYVKFVEPLGGPQCMSITGTLSDDADVKHFYSPKTEGEQRFEELAAEKGLEWRRERENDEIVGFAVDDLEFDVIARYLGSIPVPVRKRIESVRIER